MESEYWFLETNIISASTFSLGYIIGGNSVFHLELPSQSET